MAVFEWSAFARVASLLFENLTVTVLLTVLLCVTLWQFREVNARRKLPPGPTPLPLIGNIHLFLWQDFDAALKHLTKKYGDIFTVQFSRVKMVVLSSYEMNKKALARDDFAGRPEAQSLYGDVYPSQSGIFSVEGDFWRTNRKFCLRHLGEMGFGKKRFEQDIMGEVLNFMSEIEKEERKDFDIQNLLANAISNVMCILIFGKRYEYGDKEFTDYMTAINDIVLFPMYAALTPYGHRVPIIRRAFDLFHRKLRETDGILSKHLNDHKRVTGLIEKRDLIDIYLEGKTNGTGSNDKAIFEDVHIKKTIWDLFLAGTETTTSTLRWSLVYMINFPDVQEKLRSEIHRVVGTARNPTLEDKSSMPFTQAFIAEIQRIATLVPFGEFHKTTCDVEFEGYVIPEGTPVVNYINGVNMNEDKFPNPRTFRPERFVDENGDFNKSLADLTIPFGIGKRVCLGESLARMELFLFLTTLVQRFEFTAPDGHGKPSLVGTNGFVNAPLPFNVCVTPI